MRNRSRSSIMLMELMLAILVFALASALCLRLFAESRLLAEDTHDLNTAIRTCGTIENVFMSSDSSDEALDRMAEVVPGCTVHKNVENGEITYDEGGRILQVRFDLLHDGDITVINIMCVTPRAGSPGVEDTVYSTELEVFYEK